MGARTRHLQHGSCWKRALPDDVSFDALNLWASKREFVISQNRTETQNPRPLNLWGRGFVLPSAAAAGCGHRPPLNLWASKRGLEVRNNRIETKKLCPLSLWGHSFVISSAAATGSRHSRQHGSCWQRAQPAGLHIWKWCDILVLGLL